MSHDKLIAKVQKLLALAGDGRGNEAEAEAALAKAQAIMAEHNLSLAMLDASGHGHDARRQKQAFGGQAMYKYQQQLMSSIAYVNFCSVWVQKSRRRTEKGGWSVTRTYVLVGRDVNVIAARQMFEYLNRTMERLVPISDNRMRLSRWALSWKEGCATRLRSRLVDRFQAEMRRQQEAADRAPKRANELVVMDDYARTEADANHEMFYNMEPGSLAKWRAKYEAERAQKKAEPKPEETAEQKAKREKAEQKAREKWERQWAREAAKRDTDAFNAGYDEAESISLDPQVGQAERRTLH